MCSRFCNVAALGFHRNNHPSCQVGYPLAHGGRRGLINDDERAQQSPRALIPTIAFRGNRRWAQLCPAGESRYAGRVLALDCLLERRRGNAGEADSLLLL